MYSWGGWTYNDVRLFNAGEGAAQVQDIGVHFQQILIDSRQIVWRMADKGGSPHRLYLPPLHCFSLSVVTVLSHALNFLSNNSASQHEFMRRNDELDRCVTSV